MLVLVLLSCGSEVIHGGGAGGGPSSDGGAGQAAGGLGASCAEAPCDHAPEMDSYCQQYGAPPWGYDCVTMRFISAGCEYSYGPDSPFQGCENCGNWCCPPQPWNGPTYAELDAGPDGDAPAPDGCERQPADDYACLAQQKPPYAVYCPGLTIDTAPPGCNGNAYGAGSCAGPDQGYFCCPAP